MHYGGSTGFSQSGFLMQFHVSMIQSESPMDASSACDILNGVIVILKSAWQNNCCFLGHLLFLVDIVIASWAIVPLCMISVYMPLLKQKYPDMKKTEGLRDRPGISKQCLVKQFQRQIQ